MPKPVSKRQARMMHAIMEHGPRSGGRGQPPKSIAAKYIGHDEKDLPEQSGQDRGGTWNHEAPKKGKHIRKSASFEEVYDGKGAGIIIVNDKGHILIGKQADGQWATPGGHVKDNEKFSDAAIREAKEETGLSIEDPKEILDTVSEGNRAKTFVTVKFSGDIKPNNEFKSLKFSSLDKIPIDKMRPCSAKGINEYASTVDSFSKTYEEFKKSADKASKGDDDTITVSTDDAIKMVATGLYRILKEEVEDIKKDSVKDIKFDSLNIHVRKHDDNKVSGYIEEGHKKIHSFVRKSLKELNKDIMGLFEWHLPDHLDEEKAIDETKDQDIIRTGLNKMVNSYAKKNITNIYYEIENIREEIRNGIAVDIQQAENKMMKVFDKLEDMMEEKDSKYDKMNEKQNKDIDKLHDKLKELQKKLDELTEKETHVDAVVSKGTNIEKTLMKSYFYLTKPEVKQMDSGKIHFTFKSDWDSEDKISFLNDMKAIIINKKNKG